MATVVSLIIVGRSVVVASVIFAYFAIVIVIGHHGGPTMRVSLSLYLWVCDCPNETPHHTQPFWPTPLVNENVLKLFIQHFLPFSVLWLPISHFSFRRPVSLYPRPFNNRLPPFLISHLRRKKLPTKLKALGQWQYAATLRNEGPNGDGGFNISGLNDTDVPQMPQLRPSVRSLELELVELTDIRRGLETEACAPDDRKKKRDWIRSGENYWLIY